MIDDYSTVFCGRIDGKIFSVQTCLEMGEFNVLISDVECSVDELYILHALYIEGYISDDGVVKQL